MDSPLQQDSLHHGLISLASQVLQSSKRDAFYYRLEGSLRPEFKYNVARQKIYPSIYGPLHSYNTGWYPLK